MQKPAWITPQIPGLFRERADGDWDFFPFGRFGRGYRVRSFDKDDLCDALFRFQFALVVILSLVLRPRRLPFRASAASLATAPPARRPGPRCRWLHLSALPCWASCRCIGMFAAS